VPASLTLTGVTAPRTARHALTEPATNLGPADVAGVMCGAHAQVISAAELSIGRRVARATHRGHRRSGPARLSAIRAPLPGAPSRGDDQPATWDHLASWYQAA
jgi:hypothetical protein